MLTSVDKFNPLASAIEPIRLVEPSSTLRLAVGYLPILIVRRFMPLSFAPSQNSLISTTRARNYNDIILLSSHLNDFLASTKISQYSPHDPYSHLTPPYLHVVDDMSALCCNPLQPCALTPPPGKPPSLHYILAPLPWALTPSLRCTTTPTPLPLVDFSHPLYLHDLSLIYCSFWSAPRLISVP